MRGTEKPIWLVRAKRDQPDVAEEHLFRKVIVPLDGSSEAEEVIPHVEELASRFEMEITLFHVNTETTHLEPVGGGRTVRVMSL